MSGKSATRARILDAAEHLFAESGYDAVSVRQIMREADTQLGLMNYYFASKEALLEAVVGRRSGLVNDRRRARLALIAGTDDSSIEKIVDVLLAPYFDLVAEEGDVWRSYAKLNAQLAQLPSWSDLIKRNFDEVILLLIDELERILPGIPRAEILRAFVIAVGAMLAVLGTPGRMRSLSSGHVLDDDFDALRPLLTQFMSGGLRHALGPTEKSRLGHASQSAGEPQDEAAQVAAPRT